MFLGSFETLNIRNARLNVLVGSRRQPWLAQCRIILRSNVAKALTRTLDTRKVPFFEPTIDKDPQDFNNALAMAGLHGASITHARLLELVQSPGAISNVAQAMEKLKFMEVSSQQTALSTDVAALCQLPEMDQLVNCLNSSWMVPACSENEAYEVLETLKPLFYGKYDTRKPTEAFDRGVEMLWGMIDAKAGQEGLAIPRAVLAPYVAIHRFITLEKHSDGNENEVQNEWQGYYDLHGELDDLKSDMLCLLRSLNRVRTAYRREISTPKELQWEPLAMAFFDFYLQGR